MATVAPQYGQFENFHVDIDDGFGEEPETSAQQRPVDAYENYNAGVDDGVSNVTNQNNANPSRFQDHLWSSRPPLDPGLVHFKTTAEPSNVVIKDKSGNVQTFRQSVGDAGSGGKKNGETTEETPQEGTDGANLTAANGGAAAESKPNKGRDTGQNGGGTNSKKDKKKKKKGGQGNGNAEASSGEKQTDKGNEADGAASVKDEVVSVWNANGDDSSPKQPFPGLLPGAENVQVASPASTEPPIGFLQTDGAFSDTPRPKRRAAKERPEWYVPQQDFSAVVGTASRAPTSKPHFASPPHSALNKPELYRLPFTPSQATSTSTQTARESIVRDSKNSIKNASPWSILLLGSSPKDIERLSAFPLTSKTSKYQLPLKTPATSSAANNQPKSQSVRSQSHSAGSPKVMLRERQKSRYRRQEHDDPSLMSTNMIAEKERDLGHRLDNLQVSGSSKHQSPTLRTARNTTADGPRKGSDGDSRLSQSKRPVDDGQWAKNFGSDIYPGESASQVIPNESTSDVPGIAGRESHKRASDSTSKARQPFTKHLQPSSKHIVDQIEEPVMSGALQPRSSERRHASSRSTVRRASSTARPASDGKTLLRRSRFNIFSGRSAPVRGLTFDWGVGDYEMSSSSESSASARSSRKVHEKGQRVSSRAFHQAKEEERSPVRSRRPDRIRASRRGSSQTPTRSRSVASCRRLLSTSEWSHADNKARASPVRGAQSKIMSSSSKPSSRKAHENRSSESHPVPGSHTSTQSSSRCTNSSLGRDRSRFSKIPYNIDEAVKSSVKRPSRPSSKVSHGTHVSRKSEGGFAWGKGTPGHDSGLLAAIADPGDTNETWSQAQREVRG